jgi:hypothetical protein
MKLVWTVVVLAACHPGGGDDYPVHPGGDDTPGTEGRIDAAIPDGSDAAATISGRACVLTDLRDLTSCATTGAGGLTVTLGSQTATTADDGTFTITAPAGSMLVWHVGGSVADVMPSVMPFGATPQIPVVTTADYLDALNSNSVVLAPGQQGSAFVRVVRGTAAVSGATAVASPTPTYPAFYDGATSQSWNQGATGARGMVWIAGADAGSLTVTVTPPLAADVPITVPVEADSVTFATLDVP